MVRVLKTQSVQSIGYILELKCEKHKCKGIEQNNKKVFQMLILQRFQRFLKDFLFLRQRKSF